MGLGEVPGEVRAGDKLPARWLNALRSLVLRSRIVGVGQGLTLRQSGAGVVIGLALRAGQVKWARIRSDHPQDPGGMPASTVEYEVKVLEDDRTISGLVPLNRPVRDPDHHVIPARKGSLCLVVYPRAKATLGAPPKELLVFDELRAVKLCTEP